MPHDNPGKYDDACTMARMLTQAKGALLIVIEGDHGSGFSVQVSPELIPIIPGVLRSVAASIERDPDQVTHVIDILKDALTLPGQRRETIRGNQQSHGKEIAPDMTEAKFFTQYCGGDVSTRVKQLAAFFNTIVLTGTKPLTTSGIPESVPWRHHRQEGRLQEDGLSRLHRPDAGPSSATATRFAPSSAKASTNAPPPSPVLPRHPQAVGCHPTRRAIETQKLTIYALVRRSPKHLRLPPRI